MKLLTFLFACLLLPAVAHAEKTMTFCQLDEIQNVQHWPFSIIIDSEAPSLDVSKTAASLMVQQAQYFSGKSSPFMKNNIPPELGFYQPNVTFLISPYVTYSQTLDGRECAKVVGAKMILKHRPIIYLAKELAAKNCVSRAALSQQFLHNDVTIDLLKYIKSNEEEIKAEVFSIYETQGASGKDRAEISRQLSLMERTATSGLFSKFYKDVLVERRERVITRDIFAKLYSSCNGDFEKASELGKKKEEHRE